VYLAIDAGRMELVANYLMRCPAAEKYYSDLDVAWRGAVGSQIETERGYLGPDPQHPWSERNIQSAYSMARVGLTAVAEQAMAIARLITDPTLGLHGLLGVDACCRSAVEISSRVFWLTDPSLSAHVRACRSMVDRLYSAVEAERVATAMGWKGVSGISQTSDSVRQSCDSMGLGITGGSLSPEVGGEKRPSATQLITALVEATPYRESRHMIYNVLSASSHGTLYGLLRSFRPTDETYQGEEMKRPGNPGGSVP
jgi:hypothetical protein